MLPFLVYGSVSILGGGLVLFLPETSGTVLQDTIHEVNHREKSNDNDTEGSSGYAGSSNCECDKDSCDGGRTCHFNSSTTAQNNTFLVQSRDSTPKPILKLRSQSTHDIMETGSYRTKSNNQFPRDVSRRSLTGNAKDRCNHFNRNAKVARVSSRSYVNPLAYPDTTIHNGNFILHNSETLNMWRSKSLGDMASSNGDKFTIRVDNKEVIFNSDDETVL